MTATLMLYASTPLLHWLFQPVTLAEQVQRTPLLIFAVLEFSLATAFFALWRTARDFRIFRGMGFFMALVGVDLLCQYLGVSGSAWTVRALTALVLIEMAAEAMRIRNRRWTRYFWPIYLFAAIAGWFHAAAFTREWPIVISEVALSILVVQSFRQDRSADRLTTYIFLGYFFVRMPLSTSFQRLTGIGANFRIGNWEWQFPAVVVTMLGAVILAVFVRDLIRDRRDKMRMAAELAASRAIQRVLIPEVPFTVPGFAIESVYRPYGEVGGDFFQILPTQGGGVLVVIGDVSGKGMPAAMTVSLLVGTVRTLAHYTQHPGEVLSAMNHRMMGRTSGGFTTCLVLRADPDGALTVANAGHLAPYVNGSELRIENGLPLGLDAAATYPESHFQLAERDQLTLLTDGVAEARSRTGELFGFERTQAIATQPAESIAQAAQDFGQDDDITVLTVARVVAAIA